MFVVDASVVLAWCLDDETSDAADDVIRRLLTEGGIAPAHWPVEIASGLQSAIRRGRLDDDGAQQIRPRLELLPVEILPVELSTALSSMGVARKHDLSVYDAMYLDLAAYRGVGLATVDARLANACRSARVPLIAA